MVLQHINIPLSYLSVPTLAIRAFNNTLSSTLGVVVLPIRVGARSIPTACHVVEGDMQYNILLCHPWIDEMEGVSSFRHGYFKYLYEGKMHYIPMDENPFSHCNLIQTIDPFSMPILLLITILLNKNPNQTSSSSQVPPSLNHHPNLSLGQTPPSSSPPSNAPYLDHSKGKSINEPYSS